MIIVMAFVVAVIYIIVKTAMDNTINSISQMKKRLRIEPLGEIHRFTGVDSRSQLVKLMSNNPLDFDMIHSMRTRMLLDYSDRQCVAINSLEHAEGRSFLAHLLANAFSFDQKTVLIDVDFFNQTVLSQDLACPTASGVADVLNGTASISSLLLLSSEHFVHLMAELRKRYQRIIINMAAVNQTQDMQLISRAIDGVIVIVMQRRPTRC